MLHERHLQLRAVAAEAPSSERPLLARGGGGGGGGEEQHELVAVGDALREKFVRGWSASAWRARRGCERTAAAAAADVTGTTSRDDDARRCWSAASSVAIFVARASVGPTTATPDLADTLAGSKEAESRRSCDRAASKRVSAVLGAAIARRASASLLCGFTVPLHASFARRAQARAVVAPSLQENPPLYTPVQRANPRGPRKIAMARTYLNRPAGQPLSRSRPSALHSRGRARRRRRRGRGRCGRSRRAAPPPR